MSTGLNVAAKPFVPSFGAAKPTLNVAAKPFVPLFEADAPATAASTATVTTPAAAGDAADVAAAPATTTATPASKPSLLPASLAPVARRTTKSAADKVRKVKSATTDDDDAPRPSRPNAALGSQSAVTAASAERRDNSAITADGIPNLTGETRRYTPEFLLSLRSLPICTITHAAWMEGFDGLLRPQLANGAKAVERESRADRDGGSQWRDANAANANGSANLSLRPSAGLRPGAALRPGQSSQSSVTRLQQSASFQRGPATDNGGKGSKGGRDNKDGGGGYRKRGPDAPMDIEIAPLEKSDNRYTVIKDIPVDAKLLRSLNAILNKLTPEKFDILLTQVLDLKITNVGLLRDCVTAVFEKSLAEPNFSPMYAEFCVKLSSALPTFESDGQTHSFRKLILNQCQSEFQNPIHILTQEQVNTMTQIERDEHTMMAKRRTLGTIRFIGELYVRQMIASSIMRQCITMLFGDRNAPVEEDLEALCKLLETTGKSLATSKAKDAALNAECLQATLKQLSELKEQKGMLSSRLRFMIADVGDMANRGWVSRRQIDQAKKISDLHAEQQANEQQVELQRLYQSMNLGGGANTNALTGGRAHKMARVVDRYAVPTPEQKAQQAEGWETVQRGPSAATALKKASASPKHTQRESAVETNGAKNAYDLLERDDERANDYDDEEMEKPTSSSKSSNGGKGALSEEQMRQKLASMVRDYLQSLDAEDAALTVNELHAAPLPSSFIEDACMSVLELKERDRLSLVNLIAALHQRSLIQSSTIVNAFQSLLPQIDDLSLDLPQCDAQLALIVGQLAVKRTIRLDLLSSSLLESLGSHAKGLKFLALVLTGIKQRSDETVLVQTVKSSEGWSLSSIISAAGQDPKKFLTDKKIDALVPVL